MPSTTYRLKPRFPTVRSLSRRSIIIQAMSDANHREERIFFPSYSSISREVSLPFHATLINTNVPIDHPYARLCSPTEHDGPAEFPGRAWTRLSSNPGAKDNVEILEGVGHQIQTVRGLERGRHVLILYGCEVTVV